MRPLHGSITALITPFADGAVDFKSFDDLVEWQIESGTHGLVPCGTTGETPTLTGSEYKAIVQRCVDVVKGRVPVIAGSATNSTATTIELTQMVKDCGADAALIATPYYNRPTQAGLVAHYTAITKAVAIPVVLYNVPARTGVDMAVDTVVTLAALPNIIALKDAHADTSRPTLMRALINKPFALLSGEDGTAPAYLAQGGDGCISVVSNVAPTLAAQMQDSWKACDMAAFARARDALAPLSKAIFFESSPAPVKYAVFRTGRISTPDVRLPLLPATNDARAAVDAALGHAGLLPAATARVGKTA